MPFFDPYNGPGLDLDMPTSPHHDEQPSLAKLDKLVAVLAERVEGLTRTVKNGFDGIERQLGEHEDRHVGREEFNGVKQETYRRIENLESSRSFIVGAIVLLFLGAVGALVYNKTVPTPTSVSVETRSIH